MVQHWVEVAVGLSAWEDKKVHLLVEDYHNIGHTQRREAFVELPTLFEDEQFLVHSALLLHLDQPFPLPLLLLVLELEHPVVVVGVL